MTCTTWSGISKSMLALASAGCAGVLLTACGDHGGTEPVVTPSTTLSGVAAKGALKSALVRAFPVDAAGVVGATEIARKTTDATGGYTLDLGSYTGAVHLVVTAPAGATTADEASGQDVALPSGFVLHASAVVPASTGSQTLSAAITPFTELAYQIAKASPGGVTAANIASANGVVFALIGLDPVATMPIASNAVPPTGATDVQKRYALFDAAVSKLADSAPQTTDAATLACFSAAGADRGKKIECATQQIAGAVTVSTSGTQVVTAVNNKLVGLSDALVAAAADAAINKTGVALTTNDSAFKTLDALETAAASGVNTPISGGTDPQARGDVATAKQFFSALRSNAAALQSGTVDTGILDGVKAFGDSLNAELATFTGTFMQMGQLPEMALSLWTDYKAGLTTHNSKNMVPSYLGGCTVFQGSFPTSFGGVGIGVPYQITSVPATSAANARWVGCSANPGPLPTNGTRRYRQTILFDTSADPTLGAVPYIAVTRADYVQGGTTYQVNLTPVFSGTLGQQTTGGERTGASMVGDLPPVADASGTLLAERYPVDIAFSATLSPSTGLFTAILSRGRLSVVARGATQPGLVIDLSPGGGSQLVIAPGGDFATTVASAKLTLVARISDARGTLNGSLLIDQLSADSLGNLLTGHAKFTGEVAVAPVVNGVAGAPVTFLNGGLEFNRTGSSNAMGFNGSLNLPGRPAATLTMSVTETPADSGTMSFEGRYVQSGVTVTITGSRTTAANSVTFADSTGVSTTVTSSSPTANVTVGGRQTAVIDKATNRITYRDGTFESLT